MTRRLTPYCHHYHRAMAIVANRWTLELVRALLAGASRFSELAAAIPGLSDRLLAERLRTLEAEGIVTRTVVPEMPVRVEYHLTPKGRELEPAVRALKAWAERWVSPEELQSAG